MREFFEVVLALVLLAIGAVVILGGLFFLIGSLHFETRDQNVSGVVYNVGNDNFLSGNTTFSVRAAENTYVSEENRSSFCLPAGSKYIGLVNEAAENKDIKVSVKTTKYLTGWKLPWYCEPNVTVTKVGDQR